MKPRPIVQNQDLMFKSRLSEQLNPKHELLRLAKTIEWKQLEMEFSPLFSAGAGHPPLPIRLACGLMILQHMFDLQMPYRGFFVPSLFTMMASSIDTRHAGRLFGAVDTTDTLALSLSSGILWLKERLKIKEALVYTLFSILFLISCFFYRSFIKRFTAYEKRQQRKDFSDSNK